MKTITRVTTALLSGLLLILGFGGCRSSKRAAEKAQRDSEQARQDSIDRSNNPVTPIVRPDDPRRVRLLYGAPPVRYRNDITE